MCERSQCQTQAPQQIICVQWSFLLTRFQHAIVCLLLWSDGVGWSIFEEIVDVVVVDLNVGHKNAVTTVIIHSLQFTCLLWVDHVCKLWVSLLPGKQIQRRGKMLQISKGHLQHQRYSISTASLSSVICAWLVVTLRRAFWAPPADCLSFVSPEEHQLDPGSPSHFCRPV